MTHILQNTQRVFGNAGNKATWEAGGGATLAEQLVGFRALRQASGQDLGYTVWNANRSWYSNFIDDLANYFGYSSAGHVTGAPEQCSWLGLEKDGNTGPCRNGRAPYGVPATLLRYVLDAYGRRTRPGKPH